MDWNNLDCHRIDRYRLNFHLIKISRRVQSMLFNRYNIANSSYELNEENSIETPVYF